MNSTPNNGWYRLARVSTITLTVGVLFISGNSARAITIIAEQAVSSTPANDTAVVYAQTLGTGLSGVADIIAVKGRSAHALYGGTPSNPTMRVHLVQCDDSGYSTNCTTNTTNTLSFDQLSDDPQSKNFVWASPTTMNASKYYYLNFESNGGSQIQLYGNTANIYSGGACINNGTLGSSTNRCTNLADLYFSIYSNETGVGGLSITNPTNGTEITNAGGFVVSGTCISENLGGRGYVIIRYSDQSTNNVNAVSERAADCTDDGTFTDANLLWNSEFNIKAFQYVDFSGTISIIESNTVDIEVNVSNNLITEPGISPNTTLPGNADFNCDTGAWTDTFCYVIQFLFQPNSAVVSDFLNLGEALKSKLPFAYFYDIKETIESVSETGDFPSLVISMDGTALPMDDITLFDADTVTELAGETNVDLFRLLAAWAIFFVCAYSIYLRITSLIKT